MTATPTDILEFTAPIKLYTFKSEGRVKLSFLIAPHCVRDIWMSISHFQHICDNWQTGVAGLETDAGKFWWEHRQHGPRPECQPADFVAISWSDWNFRISTRCMFALVDEFKQQLKAVNHWD